MWYEGEVHYSPRQSHLLPQTVLPPPFGLFFPSLDP